MWRHIIDFCCRSVQIFTHSPLNTYSPRRKVSRLLLLRAWSLPPSPVVVSYLDPPLPSLPIPSTPSPPLLLLLHPQARSPPLPPTSHSGEQDVVVSCCPLLQPPPPAPEGNELESRPRLAAHKEVRACGFRVGRKRFGR
jgi:hypothetical protein